MVVVREKHGVSLREAENAIRGLTNDQILAKARELSARYKAQLPLNFGVDQAVTIKHLQTPSGLAAQRILGLANWLVDYRTHGNSFAGFVSTAQDIGGFQEVPPVTKLTESMKDEEPTRTELSALVKAQMVKSMTLPASEIISIRGVN